MTGTPACIWRSTGELVAVNKEFLYLTGWQLTDLLLKNNSAATSPALNTGTPRSDTSASATGNATVSPRCIYELFDTDSFLKYYEEFGKSFSDACIAHFQISCHVLKKVEPQREQARLKDFHPKAHSRSEGTLADRPDGIIEPSLEWLPFQCWMTIKRDIYDIPLMIFGHFLPSF